MKLKIAVLSGDGIGPEVCEQAVKVLKAIETKFRHVFRHKHVVDHVFELRHNHVFQSNFFLPSYYGRLAHPLRIAEAPAFDSE